MARMILPSAVRSATAVPGKSDLRDENIYSAICVAHGAQGTASMFTVPKGQTIPLLRDATLTAAVNSWQNTYSLLTTVLEKAGELGNNIGDAGIRAIGLTLEAAPPVHGASYGPVPATPWGATVVEASEVFAKSYFELKVSNKRQILGPAWAFPQTGGFAGAQAVSQTLNAVGYSAGNVQSAGLPLGRKLKIPIMVARNDVLVGEFTAHAAYVFTTSTGAGQPTLVWCNLVSTVKGDVR
jgi:hypothetical protein